MSDGTYLRLAEAVLVAHQRNGQNCLCGGLELGQSWARHVAEILKTAGALK